VRRITFVAPVRGNDGLVLTIGALDELGAV
jgi:hypothetical protein